MPASLEGREGRKLNNAVPEHFVDCGDRQGRADIYRFQEKVLIL